MAQLPLKFSSTFYIAHATSTIAYHYSPRRSTDSIFNLSRLLTFSSEGSIDMKALRSVLSLFRSPKRKRGSASPSSLSRRSSKFRACFLPSDGCNKINWDSCSSDTDNSSSGPDTDNSVMCSDLQSSEKVSNEIRRDSNDAASDGLQTDVSPEMNASGDGKDEEVKCDSSPEMRSSVGDSEEVSLDFVKPSALEIDAMSVTTMELVASLCSAGDAEVPKLDLQSFAALNDYLQQKTDIEIVTTLDSVKKGEMTLCVNHGHGLALFIGNLLRVMNNSGRRLSMSNAKRKLENMINPGKHNGKGKGKKKSWGSKKYEYRHQIWTRPILMGKRCRKLNDDFPYGDDGQIEVAAAAESMAVDNRPKVSDSSAVALGRG